jgi:glycolate oxidase iron-sulfur subunit
MPLQAYPHTPEPATLWALADQCVQCGLCLPHCPTYGLDASESESPRGRIAYMKALAGGQIQPTELGDLHLDHCLGCRRCEAACPAGVHYGALLIGSRSLQAGRKASPWRRRLALALLAKPRLLGPLLGLYRRGFSLLPARLRSLPRPPRPPASPAPDSAAAGMAVFVGCVAGEYEGPARAALSQLLAASGMSAATPSGQGCCGAAAANAGQTAQAEALARANRHAFAGAHQVLCLASGCQHALAASLAGQAAPVSDALGFLDLHGAALRFRSAGGRRMGLHVPCTQRSAPALRRLLARIPDLDLVELPDRGCCGAAGLHQIEFPERAAALRAPLLQALAEAGAEGLLSANIGCRLHLGAVASVPVRHPLEFLAEHLA